MHTAKKFASPLNPNVNTNIIIDTKYFNTILDVLKTISSIVMNLIEKIRMPNVDPLKRIINKNATIKLTHTPPKIDKINKNNKVISLTLVKYIYPG